MSTTKGTESIDEQGAIRTEVETIDHRSPAGEGREPTKEKVGVVHLTRNKESSGSKGGILSGAADAVSKTVQSAKAKLWSGGGGGDSGSSNK